MVLIKRWGVLMKKIYVVDTNVMIQAPYALYCFDEHDVVLPMVVVEELDQLKKAEGERGANARSAIRLLETLRQRGNLLSGVPIQTGGSVRIESNFCNVKLSPDLPQDKSDNRILMVCKGLAEGKKPGRVVLVTKDLVLRIKAQLVGIPSEDFTTEQVSKEDENYTGRDQAYFPEAMAEDFKNGGIPVSVLYHLDEDGNKIPVMVYENEFFVLRPDQSSGSTLLGRVEKDRVVSLQYGKQRPYGIQPRNVGQYFLQEALMESAEKAPLVIIKGMAGTAKTFYSLAVGLEKLFNNPSGEYRRIIVSRPNSQFDDDIGFLPGDEQEKISPLMRPVIDSLEQLLEDEPGAGGEASLTDRVDEIFERGIIRTEALTYIRGRSFVRTFLIIDEAQNITPNQAKGIITRAGRGTKIIILGDSHQIDRPFLDERTNGLSYAAKCMRGSPLCWQLTMANEECERSPLALDAARRL